ncbi:MAG: WD40 repeat domain-containing protein [Phycisphaerae bacterium]
MKKHALWAVFSLVVAMAAQAGGTQTWHHQTEKDYAAGVLQDVQVDKHGQLRLGRKVDKVLEQSDHFILSVVASGNSVFFAAVGEGKVYRVALPQPQEFYGPEKGEVWDLTRLANDPTGGIIAVTHGEDTVQVVKLTPPPAGKAKVTVLARIEAKGASVSSFCVTPDGGVYLALYTGTDERTGKIVHVSNAGKSTDIFKLDDQLVQAMTVGSKGELWLGYAEHAIVAKVDPTTGKAFIVLDAGKQAVTSLVATAQGDLYVAVGSADSTNPWDEGKENDPGTIPDAAPATPQERKALPAPALQGQFQTGPRQPTIRFAVAEPLPATTKASPIKPPVISPKPDAEAIAGNALYRVGADLSVEELWQPPAAISGMQLEGEQLILSLLSGQVVGFDPQQRNHSLLAQLEHTAILCPGSPAPLLSDGGDILRLTPELARKGTMVSEVLDASHVADWGAIKITAQLPEGTQATIAVRSGNVADVDTFGKFWSDWSAELPANQAQNAQIPAARFMQYRVTMQATVANTSPAVNDVLAHYQVRNLAPNITALTVSTGAVTPQQVLEAKGKVEKTTEYKVGWEATDPNGDKLTARLYVRAVGQTEWTLLAKDITDEEYVWDTKNMADGSYQLQLVLDDGAANPAATTKQAARISAPFMIDHTPPVVSDLKAVATDDGKFTVTGKVTDAKSTIVDVRMKVEGLGDWHICAIDDKLLDSLTEGFAATTPVLGTGNYRVVVQATDAAGNTAFSAVTVTVK